MKYEIKQTVRYEYDTPATDSVNQMRVRPLSSDNQSVQEFKMTLNPNVETHTHLDYWGNQVDNFYVTDPHDKLEVEIKAVAIAGEAPVILLPLSASINEAWGSDAFQQKYAEFLMTTEYTDVAFAELDEISKTLWAKSGDAVSYVRNVMSMLYEEYTYESGSTDVSTKASEVIRKKKGVCQDFTHVMLALCRFRKIPARYVSGYVYPGEDRDLRGDVGTHAWVEVMIPEFGWVGFDPTNNVQAGDHHITVATGRDYNDVVPLKGMFHGGGQQKMNVHISVNLLSKSSK